MATVLDRVFSDCGFHEGTHGKGRALSPASDHTEVKKSHRQESDMTKPFRLI